MRRIGLWFIVANSFFLSAACNKKPIVVTKTDTNPQVAAPPTPTPTVTAAPGGGTQPNTPGAPEALTFVQWQGTSAIVSFRFSGGPLSVFEGMVNNIPVWRPLSATTGQPSQWLGLMTSIPEGSTLRIRGAFGAGQEFGPPSAPITVGTAVQPPPPPPPPDPRPQRATELAVTAIGPAQVKVSWKNNNTNVGAEPFRHWVEQCISPPCTAPGDFVRVGYLPAQRSLAARLEVAVHPNLRPSTAYSFRVLVGNFAGVVASDVQQGTTTPTPPGLSPPHARYVFGAFGTIFRRLPDLDLLNAAVGILPGQREFLVSAWTHSPEAYANLVRNYYLQYLDREADTLAVNNSIKYLRDGGSQVRLASLLISSNEFAQKYQVAGNTPAFLTIFWKIFFGREPSAAELQQYGGAPSATWEQRDVLVKAILTTPVGMAQFLNDVYRTFLFRDIDPAGRDFFVPLHIQAANLPDPEYSKAFHILWEGILHSKEFIDGR